jgi:hypothetical protein
MSKKSVRKPAKPIKLQTTTDAKRFLVNVCQPRVDRIVEDYGVLYLFGDQADCGPFDDVTIAVRDPGAADAAIQHLYDDESTKALGAAVEDALMCEGERQFGAGYLLGLAVGRKIGGGR